MAWYLFLAVVGYAYLKWPKFRVFAHVSLIVVLVVGGLLFAKTGYIGPFFEALVSIPVNLAAGLWGLVTALLA